VQKAIEAGFAAQDFRASRAEAYRRLDAGGRVSICARCGTETDVPDVVHDRSSCAPDGSGRISESGRSFGSHKGVAVVQPGREEHETSPAAGRPEHA
jgi:hypothetical protein